MAIGALLAGSNMSQAQDTSTCEVEKPFGGRRLQTSAAPAGCKHDFGKVVFEQIKSPKARFIATNANGDLWMIENKQHKKGGYNVRRQRENGSWER